MVRIFLSSTEDLEVYRKAVYKIFDKVDGFECIGMENFGAMPITSLEVCLLKISECDLYIGIIGNRFGSCPPESGKSYTQHEFEYAKELNIPCFIYKTPDDFEIKYNIVETDSKRRKQSDFRQKLNPLVLWDKPFNSPDQLAGYALASIANFYRLGGTAKAAEAKNITYVVHGPKRVESYEIKLKNDRKLSIIPNKTERHVIRVEVIFGGELESVIFDYSQGVLPSNTNFIRASWGSFMSPDNNLEVAESNEPRFEEISPGVKALLIEPARTNHLFNSEAPETQSVQLHEGEYTLSVCGNGAATINPVGDNAQAQRSTLAYPVNALNHNM